MQINPINYFKGKIKQSAYPNQLDSRFYKYFPKIKLLIITLFKQKKDGYNNTKTGKNRLKKQAEY